MDKLMIFQLYPEYDTVYGPYSRPDGRMHVVLTGRDFLGYNYSKTISYPKLLLEIKLQRRLLENETADHQDRDFTNNSFNNLVPRFLSDHASLDALRVRYSEVSCPMCETKFIPTREQLRFGRAGPFCSRNCSGRYGAGIQNGNQILEKSLIEKDYYRLNKT